MFVFFCLSIYLFVSCLINLCDCFFKIFPIWPEKKNSPLGWQLDFGEKSEKFIEYPILPITNLYLIQKCQVPVLKVLNLRCQYVNQDRKN